MTWLDLRDLIPHRPPILLVDKIIRAGDGEVVCRGVLPPYDAELRPHAASPFLALELAAQAAAVLAALERGGDQGPEDAGIGYLAAIREARFAVSEMPAGRRLLATVTATAKMGPLSVFSATVTLEDSGEEVAAAHFSTYARR